MFKILSFAKIVIFSDLFPSFAEKFPSFCLK